MSQSNNAFWGQVLALTIANMKSRYRKTFSGFLWVLLNPLILYGAQALVFSRFLRLDIPDYGLFLLSGLLPWIFIAQSLEMCTNIFVQSSQLLKSYPVHPLVYLMAQLLDNLFNFLMSFLIILIPVWTLSKVHSPWILLLPLPLGLLAIGVWGMSWLLATLQVFLRDTKFVLTFGLGVAYFLTPIFYPREFIPEGLRWMVDFNPLYNLIVPFRYSVYQFEGTLFLESCARSAATGLLILGLAAWYWRRKKAYVYFNI